MARIRLKYVTADVDRYGKTRYYYRRRGKRSKVRLPGLPGSTEFMATYEACLSGVPLPVAPIDDKPVPASTPATSFRWLCLQHFQSNEYKTLAKKTKDVRRSTLEKICDLKISDQSPLKVGDAPFAEMTTKAVRRIRDRKSDKPGQANTWLKGMKALFKWAVEEELCDTNPAKDVPKFKVVSDGYHTWTEEEVTQFENAHPAGSLARLALHLLLYTGCRRADVPNFGPQNIKDGKFRYTQQKNERNKPVRLTIPVLPDLAETLAATPTDGLVFIKTEHGEPFTVDGFGRRFRKWCDAADLPHCTAHGLRKAGAVRCAENGATPHELMAIFGWSDINMAMHYTKRVEQKKLADQAMGKLSNVSHIRKAEKISGTKSPKTLVNQ